MEEEYDEDNVLEMPDRDREFSVMNIKYISYELTDYKRAFSGFDKLEVITFSYDLGFIQEISDYFQEITIILGCEALVKDNAFAMVLESEKYIINEFTRYPKLRERVRDGSVVFKILNRAISHEKLYMMSDYDDERTRVISGSANFTRRGFSGPGVQRENYEQMDDDPDGFDYIHAEFEALDLECADIIPEDTLVSAEKGNLTDDEVPVAKNIVVHNANFLLQEKDGEWNETAFLTNIEAKAQEANKYYPKISDRTKRKEITPKHISTAVKKRKEDDIKRKEAAREYSTLHVDYDTGRVLFNGVPYDMENVDLEKVKSDLTIMGEYFDGYNEFDFKSPHTATEMKLTYYKLMNFMLLSPFIAMLRSVGHFNDFPENSFPYYALIRGDYNAGKTMFVKTIQQLMTGRKIPVLPTGDFTKNTMTSLLATIEGMPMCLDDMTGDQFKQADNIVKNDVILYDDEFIHHGTFIITSNSIKSPKKEISKRMFVLNVSGTRTDSDARKRERAVKALLKDLTTEFYTEYLKRMLPEVNDMIYKMRASEPSDEWIPDIFQVSSETVLKIYEECGMETPDYVVKLTYDDYFGDANLCIGSKEIIADAWKYNQDAFEVRKAQNVLEYTVGTYPNKAEELMRILPDSLNAKQIGCKVVMDLDQAKSFFGINFKNKSWWRR